MCKFNIVTKKRLVPAWIGSVSAILLIALVVLCLLNVLDVINSIVLLTEKDFYANLITVITVIFFILYIVGFIVCDHVFCYNFGASMEFKDSSIEYKEPVGIQLFTSRRFYIYDIASLKSYKARWGYLRIRGNIVMTDRLGKKHTLRKLRIQNEFENKPQLYAKLDEFVR